MCRFYPAKKGAMGPFLFWCINEYLQRYCFTQST